METEVEVKVDFLVRGLERPHDNTGT